MLFMVALLIIFFVLLVLYIYNIYHFFEVSECMCTLTESREFAPGFNLGFVRLVSFCFEINV